MSKNLVRFTPSEEFKTVFIQNFDQSYLNNLKILFTHGISVKYIRGGPEIKKTYQDLDLALKPEDRSVLRYVFSQEEKTIDDFMLKLSRSDENLNLISDYFSKTERLSFIVKEGLKSPIRTSIVYNATKLFEFYRNILIAENISLLTKVEPLKALVEKIDFLKESIEENENKHIIIENELNRDFSLIFSNIENDIKEFENKLINSYCKKLELENEEHKSFSNKYGIERSESTDSLTINFSPSYLLISKDYYQYLSDENVSLFQNLL